MADASPREAAALCRRNDEAEQIQNKKQQASWQLLKMMIWYNSSPLHFLICKRQDAAKQLRGTAGS